MSESNVQLVWWKRDLRVEDHAPLAEASGRGPVWAVFLYEPTIWEAPDMDGMHWEFVRESLVSLRQALRARGLVLQIVRGEAVPVFESIRRACGGRLELWSHQETGNARTYARDRAVAAWARAHRLPWHERRQQGVVRGRCDRDRWSHQWEGFMAQPTAAPPAHIADAARPLADLERWARLPGARQLGLPTRARAEVTPGGRETALELLDGFLLERGRDYSRAMSSPVTAYDACSRLSAPLAWGCVSLREVVYRTRERIDGLRAEPRRDFPLRSLCSFLSRCHWHCHFIQKLESEPAIEFQCVHRGYEGLREPGAHPARLAAWQAGQTGLPFIDACMRALCTHGWINFRMRAMLVSFAAYHLWLDWRDFAPWLARQFVDYEPGIHYPQVQMQSGVTGINTLRIYNPVKQGFDHDAAGDFIARYVPELAGLEPAARHEPWKAGRVPGYPAPLVDLRDAGREARARLGAVRRAPDHRTESGRVYALHGSRAGPRSRRERGEDAAVSTRRAAEPRDPRQGELFGGGAQSG